MEELIEIKIDNLIFDCRTSGNKEDELILFLHGWPETSFMWKKLMSSFSKKGFYCVAPNLRGYSKGACPIGEKHYSLDKLSQDVLNISEYLNKSKFHLVGHDWGASIGWKLVHDNQDKILSWTGISVPHLQAFGEAMTIDSEQKKMSQYIENFQTPALPELGIKKNNFEALKNLWKDCEPEEVDAYLEVFKNSKQLTASINYYRGNYDLLKNAFKEPILGDIHVPTLFIWGNKDVAIGSFSVSESHQYMKNDYKFVELNSGHWLVHTNYPELEKHISEHIDKNRT